jgi:glutamate racemase
MKKIGVFDSGIGGITVLTELRKQLPGVNYSYFGDTAHLPYGTKSPAQIEKLSVESARIFRDQKIDALVVACNTAASWALEAIRSELAPIPVFGVVEPGVVAAMEQAERRLNEGHSLPILVLATRATVRSHAYQSRFKKELSEHPTLKDRAYLLEQACPILVPIIEEGWVEHPILSQSIEEYVSSYRKLSPGVALLACTHYPWAHRMFEAALPGWSVVNSAQAVAQSLLKSEILKFDPHSPGPGLGKVEWKFSDPDVLPEFAKQLIS